MDMLTQAFADMANAAAIGHNAHTEAFEKAFWTVAIEVEKKANQSATSFDSAKFMLTQACKEHSFSRQACSIQWCSSEGYRVYMA